MIDDGYLAYCEYLVATSQDPKVSASRASICGCNEFITATSSQLPNNKQNEPDTSPPEDALRADE